MLSFQRCLHGDDRRYDYRICDDNHDQYACTWSDDYHRQLQFGEPCYDRSGRWRFDGAEYILPFCLHTNILRERWNLLIILHLMSIGVDGMLSIAGRHQRRDGVWDSRWNYNHGAICSGGLVGEQYMQLAQCYRLPGTEHAEV